MCINENFVHIDSCTKTLYFCMYERASQNVEHLPVVWCFIPRLLFRLDTPALRSSPAAFALPASWKPCRSHSNGFCAINTGFGSFGVVISNTV